MTKTPSAPSDVADKFMLRLPDGMRDRLKQLAAENKRSLNAEIIARLEQSLQSPPAMGSLFGLGTASADQKLREIHETTRQIARLLAEGEAKKPD